MMSAQYQIRSRPKDQSSDEDENEENKQKDTIPSPTPSIHQTPDDEPQSVSNVIADDSNTVPAVHSAASFLSIFKSTTMRCGGGNEQSNGIVASCDALQRLMAALSVHWSIESEAERSGAGRDSVALSEFVASPHRLQFIEDFNHFMAEHLDAEQLDAVKQEMAEQFVSGQCSATRCALTTRHFTKRKEGREAMKAEDVRTVFYRQKLDSLHFQIWHLEQSGFRHRGDRATQRVQTEDDGVTKSNDDERAIDRELEEAVSAITDSKKKCAFGRFQGDGPNKFTLSVSGIDSACFAVIFAVSLCAHTHSAKTWMDRMVEYAKSEGVPLSVVENAAGWLQREGFDSDAVKQDVTEQTMASHQCSVQRHTASDPLCRALIAFIERTKGMMP